MWNAAKQWPAFSSFSPRLLHQFLNILVQQYLHQHEKCHAQIQSWKETTMKSIDDSWWFLFAKPGDCFFFFFPMVTFKIFEVVGSKSLGQTCSAICSLSKHSQIVRPRGPVSMSHVSPTFSCHRYAVSPDITGYHRCPGTRLNWTRLVQNPGTKECEDERARSCAACEEGMVPVLYGSD